MMIVTDTVTPGPKYHFSFVDNQKNLLRPSGILGPIIFVMTRFILYVGAFNE